MITEGIKNIIFDLGGVLLNIDYNLTREAFINLGISQEQLLYSQKEQGLLFDQLEIGNISPEIFYDQIRDMSYLGLSASEIDGAWNALLLDFPKERLDLLASLKGKYRLFLLSNTNIIHYEAYIANFKAEHGENGLGSYFEKMYLSHEVGLRKPDPKIFQLVLDEQKLEASQTLFIDDSKQHIDVANSLGIKTHWLDKGVVTDLF